MLWIICAAVGGALLALLAKRLHPVLGFRRLWLFYSALLAFFVAVVLAAALT